MPNFRIFQENISLSGNTACFLERKLRKLEERKSMQKMRHEIKLSAVMIFSERLISRFNVKTKFDNLSLVPRIQTLVLRVGSKQDQQQNYHQVFETFNKSQKSKCHLYFHFETILTLSFFTLLKVSKPW